MAAANAAKRLPQHLKELRIHLCQRSPASEGTRDWVKKYYVDLKKANPRFPILIRECSNVSPVVYARYEYGVEGNSSLVNMNAAQVNKTIQSMAEKKL